MVKNIILFLIALSFFDCANNLDLTRSDQSVVYKNYINTSIAPFDMDSVATDLRCDTFDAVSLKNDIKLMKIGGLACEYLFRESVSSKDEFDRRLYGDDYDGLQIDTASNNINLYSCGRISIQNGIQSLIVLRRDVHKKSLFNKEDFVVIMFNFKSDTLKSVVILSDTYFYGKDKVRIKSYLVDKLYFTLIDSTLQNEIHISSRGNSWKGLKNKPFLKKSKVYYSMFRIDSIGFVRFVPFDEDHIPRMLKTGG